MRAEVVRRLELHAPGPQAVAAIATSVRNAVRERQELGDVTSADIRPLQRPPLLELRLPGMAPAISRVIAGVARDTGARIFRDSIDLPAGAPDGRTYPDLRPLLRMDFEPGRMMGLAVRRPVKVAIVDSGIMTGHPDLIGHLWVDEVGGRRVHGVRCIDGTVDHDVRDDDGHGTLVAGTIVSVAGAVSAVQLIAVKFFGAGARPTPLNAARALEQAVALQPDIINVSWDVGLDCAELRKAIGLACASGALIVIAAGNDGSDNDRISSIPARYAPDHRDSAVTVMATDRYDEKPWFSNYGAVNVDLAAPGVAILSTRPFLSSAAATPRGESRRYRRYSGTSAAAAHVSGAAALRKAFDPGLTAPDLKRCLLASVDVRPRLRCASRGRLNIDKLLVGIPYPGSAGTTGPRAGDSAR